MEDTEYCNKYLNKLQREACNYGYNQELEWNCSTVYNLAQNACIDGHQKRVCENEIQPQYD